MAPPVTKFTTRRWRNIAVLAALVIVLLVADAAGSSAMRRTAFASGWLLLLLVAGLSSYNLRKKLSFLPLSSSAAWLQAHIYAGLLSGAVFGMHVRWRVPNGVFETLLALLFVAVFVSGGLGLIASRVFARRLGNRGNDVLFGRVPRLRNRLRAEVERLVMQCTSATESTAVPEFYARRLKSYFDRPCHVSRHLILSDRPLRKLLAELRWQDRYLNEAEHETMRQIADCVERKAELDFHYAHQVVLVYWLFVHIPLAYALLAYAAVHVVLVHVFSGVVR